MKCADENVHEEPSITEEAVPKLETASYCRGGQIRTDDLLLPKQARYRATLRPEIQYKPLLKGPMRRGGDSNPRYRITRTAV